MALMIDSTLWVDYFRSRTPIRIKQQVVTFIDRPEAAICEPVRFEVLSGALRQERRQIDEAFRTLPILALPEDLWDKAAILGQHCVDQGVRPRSLDLLIAIICLDHEAELVTFDGHFAQIGKVAPLKVNVLTRAA